MGRYPVNRRQWSAVHTPRQPRRPAPGQLAHRLPARRRADQAARPTDPASEGSVPTGRYSGLAAPGGALAILRRAPGLGGGPLDCRRGRGGHWRARIQSVLGAGFRLSKKGLSGILTSHLDETLVSLRFPAAATA